MENNHRVMTTEQKYKSIKKRLGLNDAQVAEMFGYKNAMSFYNSGEGREKIIAGIVSLFNIIADTQVGFWSLDQ